MEDQLHSQIKEHCKLSLPEGLKELMSDISREVLRAQPTDLYGFIASYLSALLVTRENLSVGAYLCSHVCECDCREELMSKLIDIGMQEDDAEEAYKVVMKYFVKERFNEGNLFSKLIRETTIDANMLPAIVEAVREAYLQHKLHNTTNEEASSGSEDDEVKMAAAHTLKLYRSMKPPEELYSQMAEKIQASYRAYGVRRGNSIKDEECRRKSKKSVTLKDPVSDKVTASTDQSSFSDEEVAITSSMFKTRLGTVSCTSLAGSMCKLPKYEPYSAHEMEEVIEKEHSHIDYTTNHPHTSIVVEENILPTIEGNKRISFGKHSVDETSEEEPIDEKSTEIQENEIPKDNTDDIESVMLLEEDLAKNIFVEHDVSEEEMKEIVEDDVDESDEELDESDTSDESSEKKMSNDNL